jgi:Putative antitoxin of bacterial toxin-antitoxin system, YdaS/YdaT
MRANTARSTDTLRFINKDTCCALALQALAAELGNMTKVAELLGVDRSTVYNWARAKRIPLEPRNYVLELEELTKLPRWFMRPDIYEWPAGAAVVTRLGTFRLLEEKQ